MTTYDFWYILTISSASIPSVSFAAPPVKNPPKLLSVHGVIGFL